MLRKVAALMMFGALAMLSLGCQGPVKAEAKFNPSMAGEFFPLRVNSVWTYQVNSKSQNANYVITDKVIGEQYVPSLNVTGMVVQEYYNIHRGGIRPIIYIVNHGYLTRLSGLKYASDIIQPPPWGRSEEGAFLPEKLMPNLTWSGKIFPFGHSPGAFDIAQVHRSYFEPGDVIVPAGHFSNCMLIETTAVYQGGSYGAPGHSKTDLIYKDWYAPNVGLIKTLALQGGDNGPQIEKVQLLKYSIPKAGVSATVAGAPHVSK